MPGDKRIRKEAELLQGKVYTAPSIKRSDEVMKAILKYPGSKWSIAKWIISFFPEHHSYLEPFFRFRRERSKSVRVDKERPGTVSA